MDWGSVAEWVSAVGGFLAVVAACIAWGVSKNLLEVEKDRDQQLAAAKHREQAELVFALGAKLRGRPESEAWSIFLVNASSKPIYDVTVHSQHLGTRVKNPPLKLGALLPGRFIAPSHPQYKWGPLIDYDRLDEGVELLLRGKGMKMITSVEFMDASRVWWQLLEGTEICEREHCEDPNYESFAQ